MSEKHVFSVDSQGGAEHIGTIHTSIRDDMREIFPKGIVLTEDGKISTDFSNPDVISRAKLYQDAVGRIINPQTGQEVSGGKDYPNPAVLLSHGVEPKQ
jgi:hypothetical protein